MTIFKKIKLVEVATIKGGKRLPLGEDFITSPNQHPYIRARDIGDGKIEIQQPVFIKEEIAQKLSRYKVRARDVCITIVGANVGEMGAVPPELDGANLTENAVKIVSNGKIDQVYLKYALFSKDAHDQMKNLAGGAAQPKLGIYKIETIEIPLPPMETQRKIGEILSAYDDLIKNNQRRISILEDMVQSLYRKWFVHFLFPGHESIKVTQSELGTIPSGWEVKPLSEICSLITRGVTPSYESGTGRFILNQKANKGHELLESEFKELSNECNVPVNKIAQFGDVLVNCLGEGTIGRVHYFTNNRSNIAVDQHMTICRSPQFGLSRYIYQYLESAEGQAHIQSVKTGATSMTMLNISILRQFLLVVPPIDIVSSYWNICEPIVQLAATLRRQIFNLQATRSLLLPKLISGEIDLSSTVFEIEEAA